MTSPDEAAVEIDFRVRGMERPARNLSEVLFALSSRPCPNCAFHEDHPDIRKLTGGPLASYPGRSEYRVTLRCSRCRRWRDALAYTVPDPGFTSSITDLGEGGPSRFLTPKELIIELDRVLAEVGEPGDVPYTRWIHSNEMACRALVCVNELAKYLPNNEAGIPDDLLDEESLAHRQSMAEKYTAAFIARLHAHLTEILARYDDDAARYQAEKQAAEGPEKLPEGRLNRETRNAHLAWLSRRKSGDGRMILRNQKLYDAQLPNLEGMLMENVFAVLLRGKYAHLEGVELLDTRWSECDLAMTRLDGARIERSTFFECILALSSFIGCQAKDVAFEDCDLDRADWTAAGCEELTFKDCVLQNMRLDQACFSRSSFRKQALTGTQDFAHLATTRGARFEDCDLRETDWLGRDLSGATFVRCKLAGAKGRPVAMEGVTLEDCDVSEGELRKMLAR